VIDPITLAFLTGVARSVPGLVSDWVRTRNEIRVEYTRAQIAGNAEITTLRRQAAIRDYPLGLPGRLRDLFELSGRLPVILVSPLPPQAWPSLTAIPERVQGLLSEVPRLGSYAQPISGAFVREAGISRFIDGEVAARTVAVSEFSREPAVLIYFEHTPRALTALAYLSTVFGSVGGDSSFSFVIARYTQDPASNTPPVMPLGGDLPAWRLINLSALASLDASDVVSQTITWFLLAVIDAYWEQKADRDPGLLASVGVLPAPARPVRFPAAIPAHTEELPAQFLGNDVDLRSRLEREARQLVHKGFQVSAEELDSGYVGMHITGVTKDVVFVVDGSYPDAPPVAISTRGAPIEIGASDWSPECTLMDVVEAIS
jgi:hypothetical protein